MSSPYKKHIVIPDVQARPGEGTEHLTWIGNYIAEKRPDVIVQIGDFADMHSLSSYDKGKKAMEGARYQDDIDHAAYAMGRLMAPIKKEWRKSRGRWQPRMVLTLGNHEDRITRAIENDPQMEGKLSLHDLPYENWEVKPFLKPVVIDGICYCLTPESRVLTTGLEWKAIGALKVGDQLYGFEEKPTKGKGRRFRTATVEAADPIEAPVFRVELSSGKVFHTTEDHRWMILDGGWQWAHTRDLRVGDRVPRVFDTWGVNESREAGWLAGMFDGEGHISKPNTKQGGIQVGCSQNPGPTMDRLKSIMKGLSAGFSYHHYERSTGLIRLTGPSTAKVKFLGEIRPERLISKLKPEMLGRMQKIAVDHVISIEPVGVRTVIQVKTSTSTMIVEGYAHHNCHYFISGSMGRPVTSARAMVKRLHQSCTMGHTQLCDVYMGDTRADGKSITGLFCGVAYTHDEPYLTAQGNYYRRQIVVKHEVRDGEYDLLFVSLDYLRRKYS